MHYYWYGNATQLNNIYIFVKIHESTFFFTQVFLTINANRFTNYPIIIPNKSHNRKFSTNHYEVTQEGNLYMYILNLTKQCNMKCRHCKLSKCNCIVYFIKGVLVEDPVINRSTHCWQHKIITHIPTSSIPLSPEQCLTTSLAIVWMGSFKKLTEMDRNSYKQFITSWIYSWSAIQSSGINSIDRAHILES